MIDSEADKFQVCPKCNDYVVLSRHSIERCDARALEKELYLKLYQMEMGMGAMHHTPDMRFPLVQLNAQFKKQEYLDLCSRLGVRPHSKIDSWSDR